MAARAGDRQAFTTLVEHEAPVALRLARAILRSDSEAQDAVQDAFVRAWRDLHRLRDPDRWTPWFRTLTVHAAIDQYRRRRRLREVELDAAELRRVDDTSGAAGERDRLRRALGELSIDDRVILLLRFAEDLDVPAIALTLGLRLGTAKARLSRATMRLREVLDTEPGDET